MFPYLPPFTSPERPNDAPLLSRRAEIATERGRVAAANRARVWGRDVRVNSVLMMWVCVSGEGNKAHG